LLELKAEYKKKTGQDYKPGQAPKPAPAATQQSSGDADLYNKVTQQGDKVRQLKSDKADKAAVTAAVKVLLELKAEYKKKTGQDYKPGQAPKPAQSKKTEQSKATGDAKLSVAGYQIAPDKCLN